MAEFLNNEFAVASTRIVRRQSPSPADGTRDIPIIIPILALIVALPAAVKAALEVNDRLKRTGKCVRLIAWAEARRARRQRNPFVALPPHGV